MLAVQILILINILILKLQIKQPKHTHSLITNHPPSHPMSYYRRDSLSIKSNKILANLFAQLILLSQKVQSFRQIIASVPYYDCVQLFRVLDRDQKGFLTVKDFSRLMGQSHKKVVTYAFSWFDQAKLGEVSRLEFIAFLMPRRNEELRQMVARRIQQPSNQQSFSTTINEQLRIFTQLLNQMISHQLKIIQQRKLLLKQQDYSLKGVLNSLDLNAHQFVSTNDILKFLKNYAIQATKQQLKDFLQILDSKLQGKVTLEQLKWMVEGLETSKGEYKEKVRNSSKRKRAQSTKRESRAKYSDKQPEEVVQQAKQFVRTPLRSKQYNFQSRPVDQEFSKISNLSSSQNQFQPSQYSSSQKQPQNQFSSTKRDQLLQKSGYNQENSRFQQILKKYRQAEAEAIKKDAELIMAEQEIKERLREEFNQRSNSRKRVITESHSIVSESRRRPVGESVGKDYNIRDSVRQQSYGRKSLHQNPSHQPTPHYTSKYDKKINTIVDNFYRRTNNNQTAPLHYSQKRHGTMSSSFYDKLGDLSYGTTSYDRYSTRRKFLEDQLERERQRDSNNSRVRPFDDYRQNFVKEEINKKLGDDIYNIKLPSRAYDALVHQARQRPLEESIKRMKQSTDRIQQQRQRMASSSGMMENISIISKDSTKKQQESAKKPGEVKEMNVFRTQVKQQPVSTPSTIYQSVYNGDSKSRGQRTTQTKYPYAQTENKMTPSLLRIEQESSLHQ